MAPAVQDFRRSEGRPGWAAVFLLPLAAAISPLDHVLAGMVAAGQGLEALCLFLNLTPDALLDRIVALDLSTPHDRPLRHPSGKTPWLAGDVRLLIQLWVVGTRVRRISERLDRSPGAIYAKARRLGLPRRARQALQPLETPLPHILADCVVGPIPSAPTAQVFSTAAGHPIRNPDSPGMSDRTAGDLEASAPPAGREPIPAPARVDARAAPTGLPAPVGSDQDETADPGIQKRKKRQSRPAERVYDDECDDMIAMRGWAMMHQKAIAQELTALGIGDFTPTMISSRLSRLQVPARERTQLVWAFDPKLAEANIRKSNFVKRYCRIKKRAFWEHRNGDRFYCREGKRSRTYQNMMGGID